MLNNNSNDSDINDNYDNNDEQMTRSMEMMARIRCSGSWGMISYTEMVASTFLRVPPSIVTSCALLPNLTWVLSNACLVPTGGPGANTLFIDLGEPIKEDSNGVNQVILEGMHMLQIQLAEAQVSGAST